MRSAGLTSASDAASTSSPIDAPPATSRAIVQSSFTPSGAPENAIRRSDGATGDMSGACWSGWNSGSPAARLPTKSLRAIRRCGEQHRDVGTAQQTDQFCSRRERAERNADRADAGTGEPTHDEIGAVRVQQGHPGTAADPRRQQPTGESGRASVGLGVGERRFVDRQEHVVRPIGDPRRQQRRHREGEVVVGQDRVTRHGRFSSGRPREGWFGRRPRRPSLLRTARARRVRAGRSR